MRVPVVFCVTIQGTPTPKLANDGLVPIQFPAITVPTGPAKRKIPPPMTLPVPGAAPPMMFPVAAEPESATAQERFQSGEVARALVPIRLPVTTALEVPTRLSPVWAFPEMTLPALGAAPPIVSPEVFRRETPYPPEAVALGIATFPAASVP